MSFSTIALCSLLLLSCSAGSSDVRVQVDTVDHPEWISLFDGSSLEGWAASENQESFFVENGNIIAHGPRSHLFYTGPVGNHNFKNFELQIEVMTTPGSNSGIYIHTAFQEEGWPGKGYEVQVNNSQSDWRRSGSLYAIVDNKEVYVADNEWYTAHITVQGKRIISRINEVVVVDYTEPATPLRDEGSAGRVLSSGTIALQAHDPDSRVHFRNFQIRLLPD